jgi:hypothetical protein
MSDPTYYNQGIEAYKNGSVVNPYTDPRKREDWRQGWEKMYYADKDIDHRNAMWDKWYRETGGER